MAQKAIVKKLAKRWADPVKRIEDTFNVRQSDGSLTKLNVPEPQKEIVRDGILGRGRKVMEDGGVVRRIIDKGRQIGYSIIQAAESILIAQDYPKAYQYYVATKAGQYTDWLEKVDQLVRDANHYPDEMGGGPIIKATKINNKKKKIINDNTISGFAANPAGMRGPTAINVILDEFAWMILRKNQQQETYTACKHFVSQGGQLTLLSTPRSTTDMFMTVYNNPADYGFKSYYKPTITNWRQLNLNEPLVIYLRNKDRRQKGFNEIDDDQRADLMEKYVGRPGFIFDEEKQVIKQPAKIPYWWKGLHELEKDRRADIELFKQENLGVAIDERYKVLKSEWIYNNLVDGKRWTDRGDSYNKFVFGIDIAKQRDLFVVTVFEKIEGHWYERYAEIMPPGQAYPVSQRRIEALYDKFKPVAIRLDNTGGGEIFGDYLEKGKCESVLQRINFTTATKSNMAENLRNVARDGKLHMLDYMEEDKLIIRHLLKVEKRVMEHTTKYSGKDVDQEGRDDGFWSVALAVCENPHRDKKTEAKMVKSAIGSTRRINKEEDKKTAGRYEKLKRELNKDLVKAEQQDNDKKLNIINSQLERKKQKVTQELKHKSLACPKFKRAVKPTMCVGCDMTSCPNYYYHQNIMKKHNYPEDKTEELKQYIKSKGLENEQ